MKSKSPGSIAAKKGTKKLPPLQMTDRDSELLRHLISYRFLTAQHFFWLLPTASQQNLLVRLRRLSQHGLVRRRKPVRDESVGLVYSPTEKAARLVAELDQVPRVEIGWNRFHSLVSDGYLEHSLGVNNLLISLQVALAAESAVDLYKVLRADPDSHRLSVQFRTAAGDRVTESVVPDAVAGIKYTDHEYQLFFGEWDRSQIPARSRWQRKVQVYREYARSSQLLERFRTDRGFIVLTVVPTEKRLLTLAQNTVAAGGRRGYWLTVANQVTPATILSAIWTRASELFEVRNEKLYTVRSLNEAPRISLLDAFDYS